jgi:hypothetical protein
LENRQTKRILEEIARRTKAAEEAAKVPSFLLSAFCFDKQLSFIQDPSLFKTAVCSRRSGKTVSCAADLVDSLLKEKRANLLYVTLTRGTAKKIIWKELLQINKDYQLGFVIDNGELTLTNPKTESILYLSGAKDASEIEKFRGMSLKKVYIDECQSFRSYIRELVDDIIVPATWDVGGSLCLIGTPGPVPAGFFYDACTGTGWKNYKWNIFDNPFIKLKSGKEPEEILAAERERKGISESDPTYMREALGLWAKDDNAIVFKFDSMRNVLRVPLTGNMDYIFGIDIGFNDADAIAVLGYSYATNKVYLVEECVNRKQDITKLVEQIEILRAKYSPIKMVMDSGALGKKIQAEIQQRHSIPLEAADKNRKLEYIELLNDDLRTGKLMALPGTRFEEDCGLVQWDYDNPEKPEISDAYHSDITDAVLYAWRECKHYIKADKDFKPPQKDSIAYMQLLEDKEAEAMERKMSGMDEADNIDDGDLDYIMDIN